MKEENLCLCEVSLGDVVFENVSQQGPSSNDDFVYVDIGSIDRESKAIVEPKLTAIGKIPSRAKQNLRAGDVLISMTRPNLNAVALVPIQLDGAIGSTGFHVLRSKWVSSKFLYYLVQTDAFINEMSSVVQGALYPAVRPKDISSFKFLLPSTFQQSRIVEKLEELLSDLDTGVAELKAAQKKLVQYRQSLLKAAVEGKLTEQWRNNRYASSPQYLTNQERGTTANDTAANTPLSPRGRGGGGEGATTFGLTHSAWLRDRARELRKAQTPQEQALWQQLRAKRFSGFKFRRQQVIGRYIADFVCFEKKLVIELDGGQHSDTKQADEQRDRWLNAQGFRVLRFWNNQWQSQQVGVLDAIWQALHENKPTPPLPNPSPTRGEGLSLAAAVDIEGESGSQPDTSFYLDERGAGEEEENGAQLLERILKQRRAHWEAKHLVKFQAQGKTPPKGWQDKYPEPIKPDTSNLPELPEGWVWASLDQCAMDESAITDGPFGSNLKSSHYQEAGPRVIRLQNIGDGVFLDAKAHISRDHYEELTKHAVEEGDLVVAMLGEVLPRACIVPLGVSPAIVKADCARIRLNKNLAIPKVLISQLNSKPIRDVVLQFVKGIGRPRINLRHIRAIPVAICPMEEQLEIEKALVDAQNAIAEQLKAIELSLKQSAAQRKNILKAAFSGQLVPQDPNDEPARVLLERIRAERVTQQAGNPSKKRSSKTAS
jgi:very-short-patch-repair endonuclease/restriction endonuclease S subunit